MRSRMRGTRTPWLLLLCTGLAILAAIGLLFYCANYFVLNTGASLSVNSVSIAEGYAHTGKLLFSVLIALVGGVIILIIPAYTGGTITLEREQQTLESLLLTPLSSRNILLGKMLPSLCFALLLLLCALPVMSISFTYGGVSPGDVAWALAVVMSAALLCGSIGVYCSVYLRTTVSAIAVAYIACLTVLLLITEALVTFVFQDLSSNIYNDRSDLLPLLALAIGLPIVVTLVSTQLLRRIVRQKASWLFNTLVWSAPPFCGFLLIAFICGDLLSLFALFLVMFVYSLPLVCLISLLYARITRRMLATCTQLILCLTLALLGILSDGCAHWFNPNFANYNDIYQLGNPIAAMMPLLGIAPQSSQTIPYMTPISVALLLFESWLLLALAERRLELQHGCRKTMAQPKVQCR